MELVYQYLTGPRFRHRIEAVVERFSDMQADLDRERKTMMRLWAKREGSLCPRGLAHCRHASRWRMPRPARAGPLVRLSRPPATLGTLLFEPRLML